MRRAPRARGAGARARARSAVDAASRRPPARAARRPHDDGSRRSPVRALRARRAGAGGRWARAGLQLRSGRLRRSALLRRLLARPRALPGRDGERAVDAARVSREGSRHLPPEAAALAARRAPACGSAARRRGPRNRRLHLPPLPRQLHDTRAGRDRRRGRWAAATRDRRAKSAPDLARSPARQPRGADSPATRRRAARTPARRAPRSVGGDVPARNPARARAALAVGGRGALRATRASPRRRSRAAHR